MIARVESITSEIIDMTFSSRSASILALGRLFFKPSGSEKFAIRNSSLHPAHHDRGAVKYDDENQPEKINTARGDADNRKRFAAVLVGVFVDLHELIDSQPNRYRRRNRAQVATPADRNREDAADHRRDSHALLWRLH